MAIEIVNAKAGLIEVIPFNEQPALINARMIAAVDRIDDDRSRITLLPAASAQTGPKAYDVPDDYETVKDIVSAVFSTMVS
ncbi:hypothetical protein [Allohahella marinimesophila]|uniref:Uncharacterized protein n=1 Tax=Allohahella marinimesophila TaxID=1054972 RepID=A0ABP7PSX7_9GAMM